jgi:hypothetical protein
VAYLFLVRPIVRASCLIAVSLLVGFTGNGQSVAEVAQGRDMRAYDDGGVYYQTLADEYIVDVERLREFVWSHWKKKQRGVVRVVHSDMDAGSTAYIFIEAVNGKWHIAWRDVHYSALPDLRPYPPEDRREIVTVERCRGSLVFFDVQGHIVSYL